MKVPKLGSLCRVPDDEHAAWSGVILLVISGRIPRYSGDATSFKVLVLRTGCSQHPWLMPGMTELVDAGSPLHQCLEVVSDGA